MYSFHLFFDNKSNYNILEDGVQVGIRIVDSYV